MSQRPHVSIVTDGRSPQGTTVWQDGVMLHGVQSVKTIREGTRVEIVIHAHLDALNGAEHPFEMDVRSNLVAQEALG